MAATIYDVAKLAGVSPATVSRVFNGTRVSVERATAVRDAAFKLQFTPNRTARTLRRQNSEVIALVIPDIENPYFTELARGVEDVASSEGFSVVLCNTDSQSEKEDAYFRIALSENMAGIIVAAASSRSRLGEVLAAGRPVVAVDRRIGNELDTVVMDNRPAGAAATRLLIDAGYRRIACITGPRHIETALERAGGWGDVASKGKGDIDLSRLLRFSTFNVEGGRTAMEELLALDDPPDALVAGNNLLGIGAIQLLTERGLTPPRVGVAVIGALPFTTLSPRAVSVVRLPARAMGEAAASMLLERIRGDRRPPRLTTLPFSLQPADGVLPA